MCQLLKKALRRYIIYPIREFFLTSIESTLLLLIFVCTLIARLIRKRIDIGLGPEPLIKNIAHKKALESGGYSAETYVNQVYFITSDFDYRGDTIRWPLCSFVNYFLFARAILRYKCLYIYFNGGPLGFTRFRNFEPFLLNIAGVRTVVMPYGGDVHNMFHARNLPFKHAMSTDYPHFHHRQKIIERQVNLWTRHATHVISGCDWVYYMHHWHTLMLGHFSIDLSSKRPSVRKLLQGKFSKKRPLRLFHAPNHTTIKGTDFFVRAVQDLQQEGLSIELVMKRKVPNHEILLAIREADVVLDQLVIGWYAMFALEAMAMEKPVICYLADDLLNLFEFAGLVQGKEIPIINANVRNIKNVLKQIYTGKINLERTGRESRLYAQKHHSVEVIGQQFARINASIGILP